MKIRYTCSDVCLAMVRDYVILHVKSSDEASSSETWQRVKRVFARRHHTKSRFVDITAVEIITD